MMTWIKKWFFKDQVQVRQDKISKLYKDFVQFQRSGKLKEAGEVMEQISKLENEIRAIQNDL